MKGESKIINLNLGTGKGTTVLELIKTFERVNSIKIPYIFVERRPGDCSSVVADNTLATNILDWQPKRSIEQMCIDGWRWQKNHPDGYI